ncbi:MAG TPA: DUF3237 family protein [Sphingomonadaceae bacterium]|nr:DUF3237 family protein [Sphingomonadaceae bacterium]
MPALSSEPWLTLEAEVAPPQLFGKGEGFERRCVPITRGIVRGRLTGTGLPGGTDWQRILPDGTTDLEAHYAFETDRGELVEVTSNGLRSGPPETMRALLAGEKVDPALIYFRTAMRFRSESPRLREFTTRLFIGVGRREPDRVLLDVYAVE